MKKLFSDNRIANMLQHFRKQPFVKVSDLASRLGVSERTVRNDIKQLNQELKPCAAIEGKQGKYSLRIFQADEFAKVAGRLIQDDDFMNSSRNRMNYIFGRLMRSEEPLLTDELAYEMNIGRTTIISDLKKLRSEVKVYDMQIIGKTSKGMILEGSETDIRRYTMENVFQSIYQDYPLDPEILDMVEKVLKEHSYDKRVRANFKKSVTLMLDRYLTGHFIGKLSAKYYNLTIRPDFEMVSNLIDDVGNALHTEIPLEEKLYVYRPILGMHTPEDLEKMQMIMLDSNIEPLIEKILGRIREEMNIMIESKDFAEEFRYHVMFMLNRLKFHVKLNNPLLDELVNKYPLAYQMAEIASDVIWHEYGFTVNEDEKGYLTAYFGLFLAQNDLKKAKPFRVAVVCGSGRVTAQLIKVQLKKVLDSSAEITLFSDEKVNKDILNQFDIILTTVDLPFTCQRPIIRIHEIFNEKELLHKIEKAKYWDQVDMPVVDNNWFVLNGLLDEDRFFVFSGTETYDEAVAIMADSLQERGYVDSGFLTRLQEREYKGTMVFDQSIALPHTFQYADDKFMIAVGVCREGIKSEDHNIKVIFLMGLPENSEMDDNLLIRIYDEIITIAQDENLLASIADADSFQELLRVLYRQAGV